MDDYTERLERVEYYLNNKEFEVATILCGKVMELILKEVVQKYLTFADDKQSVEYRSLLSNFRKTSLDKLTAGEIVNLCMKIRVLETLSKKVAFNLEVINFLNLRDMVNLRNIAIHVEVRDKIQEKANAYLMYGNLLRLFLFVKNIFPENNIDNLVIIKKDIESSTKLTNQSDKTISYTGRIQKPVQYPSKKIALLKNKSSGKHFIYLEDEALNKVLLVTPEGFIKVLEDNLFSGPFDIAEELAINNGLIKREQVQKYHDYASNVSIPAKKRVSIQVEGPNVYTLQQLSLNRNLSNTKPKWIRINSQKIDTRDWSDLCIVLIKWLSTNGILKKTHLPIYNAARRNKYFVNSKGEHQDPKKDGAWTKVEEYFIDTKYSAPVHVKNIIHLLEHINANKLTVQISL